MNLVFALRGLAVALLLATLTACGGGGSDSAAPPTPALRCAP